MCFLHCPVTFHPTAPLLCGRQHSGGAKSDNVESFHSLICLIPLSPVLRLTVSSVRRQQGGNASSCDLIVLCERGGRFPAVPEKQRVVSAGHWVLGFSSSAFGLTLGQ